MCLAYIFSRLEVAQNLTLYYGLVKLLHRADSGITWNVLLKQHLTRGGFREFFATVFGREIPVAAITAMERAERDQVMHGKVPHDRELRNAIAHVLGYTREFAEFVYEIAGFNPCGDLRGFKGATASLEKGTTRWVLKGMGFSA